MLNPKNYVGELMKSRDEDIKPLQLEKIIKQNNNITGGKSYG